MTDLDDAEWSAKAILCSAFVLDAGLGVPSSVPSCLRVEGSVEDVPVVGPAFPTQAGLVLTQEAAGRLADMVEHYGRLVRAGRDGGWRPGLNLRWHCIEVQVVVVPAGKRPVVVDMFGAAQRGAVALLGVLADPAAELGRAYDNLDQGWALRVLIEPEWVVLLEWDWDVALEAQEVLALRLPRREVMRQAAAARARLAQLHPALVQAVGVDLWNVGPERKPWWRGWFSVPSRPSGLG